MARPSKTGGKTSEAKPRKASPAKGRKSSKTQHRIPAAATRAKRRSVSGPSKGLKAAREQQAATAEILKIIASSPSDVQPVFEAIATSANRLIGGFSTAVFRFINGIAHLAAFTPTNPTADDILKSRFPRPITAYASFELVCEGEIVQIANAEHLPELRDIALARGYRSMLFTPLVSSGAVIGMVSVTRKQAGMFAVHHVELLRTFADQAVIAIENVRLFDEVQAKTRDLTESLQQQTATGDVLKVIASSPTNVGPVLQAIVESACAFCGAYDATVVLKIGGDLHFSAHHGPIRPGQQPRPINRQWVTGRSVIDKVPVQVSDFQAPEAAEFPEGQRHSREHGQRCTLSVPLLREGEAIGAIVLRRMEPVAFSDKQVALLQTFADQAVIAIGNVRLFDEVQAKTRELTEALTYQTGSSNILKVIASSPTDVQPVLTAIAESACELCEAYDALVRLRDGDRLEFSAHHGPIPVAAGSLPISRNWTGGLAAIERKPVHIHDLLSSEGDPFPEAQKRAREYGHRSILTVPMLREGESVGVIIIRRNEVHPFTDKQIALLQTFADQAVIAIGNVRLFQEVQARTRDLTESLQHQTATSDVLQAIGSSMADAQPAFDRILDGTMKLFNCRGAAIFLAPPDGMLHLAGSRGFGSGAVDRLYPRPIAETTAAAIINERRQRYIPNALDDVNGSESLRRTAEAIGNFSVVMTPMLWEGRGVGMISVTREPNEMFNDKELSLLKTFADQAVIAIENARLFDEVQARTQELSESLEQQTATSEVLSVISSSGGDLAPVFDAMLDKAMELCRADFGLLNTFDGALFHTVATRGLPVAYDQYRRAQPHNYGPGTAPVRLLQGEPIVEIEDLLESDAYRKGEPNRVALVELGGARCLLAVPLLKDGSVVGNILIFRQDKLRFSEKQIALLKQFAAQAVIAIENTRLLRELRASTDDLRESLQFQTATSEVLKVISRSPDALQPVLDVIVETSRQLCRSDASTIFLLREGKFHVTAVSGALPKHLEFLRVNPAPVDQPGSILSRVAREKRTLHYPNVADDPQLSKGITGLGGPRALLTVPLMAGDEVIGAITLRQSHLKPFTARQIEAIETFADQAVIAIGNVRLFEEVQTRTRELLQSLDDLRAAQDRLVQTEKLASLGQLTAGIAHEIKNPLNFVNNFAALSADLTDELNDVLKPITLDHKVRGEVDELTGLLKENLEKVVQHGKRADSIVKNMLLHSREGSGEHRPADVNSLLDESLNLAYHGARAEKGEFNITLQRHFDTDAGTIEVFPQEITRAFLNLISNGVYAATKRKIEDKEPGFEPTVRASTKNLGSTVQIRIRDNGNGIPAEVQEKIFNPFFTTKPPGDGTGLGLSMTHDIIVKQHGGRIDVATEPGQFTEFIIVLPRKSAVSGKGSR